LLAILGYQRFLATKRLKYIAPHFDLPFDISLLPYCHSQDGWQEASIGEAPIEKVSVKAGERTEKEVCARRL
jgi:hypothetical protein